MIDYVKPTPTYDEEFARIERRMAYLQEQTKKVKLRGGPFDQMEVRIEKDREEEYLAFRVPEATASDFSFDPADGDIFFAVYNASDYTMDSIWVYQRVGIYGYPESFERTS